MKTNLKLIVQDLKLKMSGLILENKELRKKIMEQNEVKKRFKDDIHNMLADVKDYKALKKQIVRMFKNWVTDDEQRRIKAKNETTDINANFTKGRGYLEQSLDNVTNKLTKSYKTFEQTNKKIIKEHVDLLEEFNNLKIELHNLTLKVKEQGGGHISEAVRQEIMELQGESMQLDNKIAQLEMRDHEINEQVRQMNEQAELSLKHKQQLMQMDQQQPEEQPVESQEQQEAQ